MNCFPLDNLIKHALCFKLVSSSGMNLIITNQKKLFMKLCTLESDLSDYYKTITVILKKTICKGNPKTIFYREYKSFSQKKFDEEMISPMMRFTVLVFLIFEKLS